MAEDVGVVPSEGMSPGTESGSVGPLSFLNAEWVNKRTLNVARRVNELLDRIIDDGLLGSGYPPFEMPVTDDMLGKMTPDRFRALIDSMPTLELKSALLARMQRLKLPPQELMPYAPRTSYPSASAVGLRVGAEPVPPRVAGVQSPVVESG